MENQRFITACVAKQWYMWCGSIPTETNPLVQTTVCHVAPPNNPWAPVGVYAARYVRSVVHIDAFWLGRIRCLPDTLTHLVPSWLDATLHSAGNKEHKKQGDPKSQLVLFIGQTDVENHVVNLRVVKKIEI